MNKVLIQYLRIFTLILSISFVFTACKKNEEAKPKQELIVGLWSFGGYKEVRVSDGVVQSSEDPDPSYTLEFKSDGTGVEHSDGDIYSFTYKLENGKLSITQFFGGERTSIVEVLNASELTTYTLYYNPSPEETIKRITTFKR